MSGLFAGIGGIERGLRRAGHHTVELCEFDPLAQRVLQVRFPDVPVHPDVRGLRQLDPASQLLAGGFPCQDLSQAGKTRGIEGDRSGLVGEVFRLLRTRPVPWVLLENVPFMLQLEGGRAMELLVQTFEDLGYAWAYRIIDSRSFGLPQRRQRVLFLASLIGDPRCVLLADDTGGVEEPVSPKSLGFYWTEGRRGLGLAADSVPTLKGGSTIGIPSPPAIVMPDGRVVTPDIRDAERLQGFPANWTKPAEAVGRHSLRWKLVGNAVTVSVATWLGRRLITPGIYDDSEDRSLPVKSRWPTAAWNLDGNASTRYSSAVSMWPKRTRMTPIHEFLRFEPKPLSARASAGFVSRLSESTLRRPDGFLEAVQVHRDRMLRAAATVRV